MFFRFLYSTVLVHLLYVGLAVNSLFNKKIRRAFLDRIGLWKRYRLGLPSKGTKKRVWFHVSSVGELEQARPVIRLLEENNKDVEVVLTYFSPSAKKIASKVPGLIFNDYLPLDTVRNAKKVVKLIDPDLLVFVKFDIWPNIAWQAKKRGVKTALIDATLQRKSKRYSNLFGQSFYSSVYMALDFIGTVSESDLNRFMITAPKHKNVKLVGDTRFDQVAFRAKNAMQSKKLPQHIVDYYRQRYTFICGSTWEADDKHILSPLVDMLNSAESSCLVVVPHEPETKRVDNYMKFFSDFDPVKLSQLRTGASCTRVLVVDEVGALAELYMSGTAAYIGGAFSTGVHNVMEPAIMGLPVVFGPFCFNSPEAEDLLKINCAYSGSNSQEFSEIFKMLAADVQRTKMMGLMSSEFIKKNLGSDIKYYNEIKSLLKL